MSIAKLAIHLAWAYILTSPASGSVVNDLDTRTRTFKNDGDGMVYIVSGGKSFSWRFYEQIRYPLGKDSLPRIRLDLQTQQVLTSAEPGPQGLTYSRPLADGEVAELGSALIAYNEVRGATALALNPNSDPGLPLHSFDALQDKTPCKIILYENAADVCGNRFGRAGVVSWTMSEDISGCTASGVCWWRNYKFSVGYQAAAGRRAVNFRFVNKNAAESFVQAFSSWGGSIPQRF